MTSSHRMTAVTWFAVLLALLSALSSPAAKPRAESSIQLKQVFEFRPKPWRDWPHAVLSPHGDRIFYLSGPNLQVVETATGRVVAKADYSHLSCPASKLHAWPWLLPGSKELGAWVLLSGEQQILAVYCNSLLLIDGRTFKVLKEFERLPEEKVGGVTLLSDGLRAAVSLYGNSEPGKFHVRLVFLDTRTWKEEKSWSVGPSGLALSQDGRLLVYEQTRFLSDTEARCGIEVRDLDSGKTYSEWWPTRKWKSSPARVSFIVDDPGCPSQPVFLPGSKNLMAAALGESIVIWDIEKRQVVKELRAHHLSAQFVISPDGSLLLATFVNDPEVTESRQDFIAWDIASGSIVYESPRRKWTLVEKFREPWLRVGLVLNGFSSDGKYLLVTRHRRLTLYGIVRGK